MKKKKIFIGSASILLFLVLIHFNKDQGLIWATNDIREVIKTRPDFQLDTLFVLSRKDSVDGFFSAGISKFPDKEIKKLTLYLNQFSDTILLKDQAYDAFSSENPYWLDHNNGLLIFVIQYFPFYRIIETTVLAGDGTFGIESRYYWFFRWRKLGSNVGVS